MPKDCHRLCSFHPSHHRIKPRVDSLVHYHTLGTGAYFVMQLGTTNYSDKLKKVVGLELIAYYGCGDDIVCCFGVDRCGLCIVCYYGILVHEPHASLKTSTIATRLY